MDKEQPKLTAGELSNIWQNLMNNSLASVVLDYFYHITDSNEIRSLGEFALKMVQTDQNAMKGFLINEDYPTPEVFNEKDMNPNARKPVTDIFVLFFLHHMAQIDLAQTAISLAESVREDVRRLYSERMVHSVELFNKVVSLLLEKGVFVRSPIVTSTHKINLEAKEGFLSNFLGMKPRPLTAREANELHKNILNNHIGRSLLMVFGQSNRHSELKPLLIRGKEIAAKIIHECSSVLTQNDLPIAMTWDTHVLDSTDSPFSDRLIAFLVDQLNKVGIANYGYAYAVTARKDIKSMYTRIITDVTQYEIDVKTLMIKNEWMERPPIVLDRRDIDPEKQ